MLATLVGIGIQDPNYQVGATPAGFEEVEESDGEDDESLHAVLSIISWGAIADVALILVRLMRGRKITVGKLVIPAQTLHSLLMWMVIIISGVANGIILSEKSEELAEEVPEESDKAFHYICGLIALFLMLTSIFTGPITFIALRGYNKSVDKIIGLKWIHRLSGALLYLLVKAEIITGALFYEEGEWEIGIFIYIGILLTVHILIQTVSWHQTKNSNQSPMKVTKDRVISPEAVSLLEAINKGMSREDMMKSFPKIKWVILGNGVYDLTDWIHPGGNFIIQACIGREVGRYFYGNCALEGTKIKPYNHSALAVSQLTSFYIGELSQEFESIFVNKKGEDGLVAQQGDQWKISKITPVTQSVSEISFQNPDFKVKNFGKSLSWLGRHFRVSFDRNNSLARQYTTALSLNKANYQLRQDIYKYFDEIMESKNDNISSRTFNYDHNYSTPQDTLSLFIKNYSSFNGLSNQLHKTEISDSSNTFRIEGPFGRGLELSTSSSGTHCIICAGTGILPMIDFLNLFLWKTMYQLIKEKAGNEKAEQINILKIPFDSYFNGLSIKFIGAFANSKEVLGLDIIKKLAEINKKYKTNNFEAMMKGYSDENIPAVDGDFSSAQFLQTGTSEAIMKEYHDENIYHVNGDFSSAQFLRRVLNLKEVKYYVIGPPKLNEKIPQALAMLGISHDKIILV